MITIKGVTKRFPNERAINYTDMVFEDGKSYMLLGASGCGKSTLLNMIAGILSPEAGEIYIGNEEMTKKSQKEKDKFRILKIGYIFQDFKLIPEMTVMDNINILRLENVDTSHADEILEKLEMLTKKNKKVKHLSGGEKQRVAIAGLMALEPKCIVLDEPTAMLDPQGRKEIVATVKSLNKDKGITIVYITHYMTEALAADRVVVMEKGHIRFMGTPKEVFSRVDELEKLGLEAPLAAKVASELRKSGIKLPKDIITDEELAQALCQ